MKPAFSTIACPENTIDQAIALAGRLGYAGIDLRTFGQRPAAHGFVCEPCLTGSAKLRDAFEDAGVEPACLSTSIRYDAPIFPPVIGRVIGDFEKPVRETREMVRVAAAMECPFVRVFGFELQDGERRTSGMRRIYERLDLAVKTARHTGVRVAIENGGSFPLASDLNEIMDRLDSPWLAACYSPAAAIAGGEDPVEGLRALGSRLEIVRLKDFAHATPVRLGEGEMRVKQTVEALADRGYAGWTVVEHDRMWLESAGDAEPVLADAARKLYQWSGRPMGEIERRKFAVAG